MREVNRYMTYGTSFARDDLETRGFFRQSNSSMQVRYSVIVDGHVGRGT